MSKEAIEHYEAALREAFPSGATGNVFHHWNEARKALAERPAVSAGPITPAMMQGPTPEQKSQMVAAMSKLAEQPAQQEPVAWMRHDGTRCCPDEYRKDYPDYETRYPTPLYAHPAAQGSPVAWMVYAKDGLSVYVTDNPTGISEGQRALPLYTSPPAQREPWVGLTDEDIDQGLLRSDYAFKTAEAWRAGVVFAMTKLKEKNT